MENKLHLPLTYYWFKEIEFGRKKCEYRRFTEGWSKRLSRLKKGDLVIFHRGYSSRTITRQIVNIRVVDGWTLPNEVYQFFECSKEAKFFEITFEQTNFIDKTNKN